MLTFSYFFPIFERLTPWLVFYIIIIIIIIFFLYCVRLAKRVLS